MRILVLGAGRSAYYAIQYLLENAPANGWEVTIADASVENLQASTKNYPEAKLAIANVTDKQERKILLANQDIVISLMPAQFHYLIAVDCLENGSHLITPSYTSPELEALGPDVKARGLVFLNELGLDPGIDHMSAMQLIDQLHAQGAEITSFRSYCGGLMARGSDNNPWRYKLSWNPYNVVRAGRDGGLARVDGILKYLPYTRLFKEADSVEAGGELYDAYLNRNALSYISLYNLSHAATFIRGTLRYAGFCRKWHSLISTGITADQIPLPVEKPVRYSNYFNIFMAKPGMELRAQLEEMSGVQLSEEDTEAIKWLLQTDMLMDKRAATPAEALQTLLEHKWRMDAADRDRVVMIHELEYKQEGRQYRHKAWMDIAGEDKHRTAMARTVGLPMAMGAALIARGGINTPGVLLPILPEIYNPLLAELDAHGIKFSHEASGIG